VTKELSFCEQGVVAMANKGINTNGSQFFITLSELPQLDSKYTIIGKTIKGMEILKKLSRVCGQGQAIDQQCKDVKISKTGLYTYDEYMENNKHKLKL
jgi:cyclophilin family peptidyl-prolyl cis-trans isomerase